MNTRAKVIVTGGAGYIGSHTVVALHQAGYNPVIVDNFSNSHRGVLKRIATLCGQEIHHHEADCCDPTQMESILEMEGELHGVIHFAAFKAVGESVADPLAYYHNNVGSLVNLLRIHERHSLGGLVFSSSCTVYGEPDHLPVTEKSPIKAASSPYGYTKQVCERIIDDYVQSGRGLRACTLRYFNPIGAHPTGLIGELPLGVPNNLVPFITQSAAGLRPPLRIFGKDYATPDGTAIRDYIHVVDLANAHVAALSLFTQEPNKSCNHIANVGTGAGKSVLEVVKAFEQVTGLQMAYEFVDRRPGDVPAVWAAVSDDSLPGWKAQLSLQEALRDSWNWQLQLKANPL